MILPDPYVWPFWAAVALIPWTIVFAVRPAQRRVMWISSVWTAPFGLTEPLFVPEYWDPPSLFGLAQSTGSDIESVVFSVAIGGLAVVSYNALTNRTLEIVRTTERQQPLHRRHYLALASPFLVFAVLYPFPWNPIYPGVMALVMGAISTMLCRPDLKTKTWIGGLLFLAFYSLLLDGLQWTAPGYIERVWMFESLTGIRLWGAPLEELLFAIGFGMYWAGVYEHLTWTRPGQPAPQTPGLSVADAGRSRSVTAVEDSPSSRRALETNPFQAGPLEKQRVDRHQGGAARHGQGVRAVISDRVKLRDGLPVDGFGRAELPLQAAAPHQDRLHFVLVHPLVEDGVVDFGMRGAGDARLPVPHSPKQDDQHQQHRPGHALLRGRSPTGWLGRWVVRRCVHCPRKANTL
jgi:hypothetical protein